MSSQWYFRLFEEDFGPVPFSNLVQMVRSGTLSENDLVKRDGIGDWIRARDVVGLFRAAQQQEPSAITEDSQTNVTQTSKVKKLPLKKHSSINYRFIKTHAFKLAVGIVVISAVAAVCGWWSSMSPKFPQPHFRAAHHSRPGSTVKAVRAPRPKKPSVPRLLRRVPKIVPGFEKINPAFSPTLSADLTTVIFSGLGNPNTGYDLYISTRRTSTSSFAKPKLITLCASPETDAYPALSPDGEELLFIRSDDNPQLMYSTRHANTRDFTEAIPCPIPRLNPEELRLGTPCFPDVRHVTYGKRGSDPEDRFVMISERPSRTSPFTEPQVLPFFEASPSYYIAGNRLRAYFGTPDGLYLCSRDKIDTPFSQPVLLVGAARTGPVEGTVWITPKEDVIIYSSPGPGKKLGTSRRLWMIRY